MEAIKWKREQRAKGGAAPAMSVATTATPLTAAVTLAAAPAAPAAGKAASIEDMPEGLSPLQKAKWKRENGLRGK